MKKCKLCLKDFEPKNKDHLYCPSCWNKIYNEMQQQKLKYHRVCKTPSCNAIIDDQPEHFQYCVSCWIKRQKGADR